MPIVVLLIAASAVGLLVGLAVRRYPRLAPAQGPPVTEVARDVGAAARRHPRIRALVASRLDPAAATGLALTLALVLAIAGGVLLGLLAYLARTKSSLIGFDNGVAKWGNRHASPWSTNVLDGITQLGSIYTVLGLSVLLAVYETIRERSVWALAFIVAAVGGEEIITPSVKHLVDRTRPTFNPAAAGLGPSFPSGHSATAAVFYATAALLLGRGRPRAVRAVLAGLAAGIAVAVAASRVLLDVHWLSDVIGGLALGWSWFAICGIAFGGRILRFGAAAEVAARTAGGRVSVPASAPQVRRGPRT
jgi:membrane-associated phospholipid phosphatase